jgi:16S rRNA (guanine966-N2)-methyltransferase
MRIVAGEHRGRRIEAPPGEGTRPTSDRVREALFSILSAGGTLHGEAVLDLYAGSGALGLEALSRGADTAEFVEHDPAAARALRANLDALRIPPERAKLHRADVLGTLHDARNRAATYSLVVCDPPYRLAPELGEPLSEALEPVLAPGARVVTESDRRAPLSLSLPLTDERRYGDTLIRIHHT